MKSHFLALIWGRVAKQGGADLPFPGYYGQQRHSLSSVFLGAEGGALNASPERLPLGPEKVTTFLSPQIWRCWLSPADGANRITSSAKTDTRIWGHPTGPPQTGPPTYIKSLRWNCCWSPVQVPSPAERWCSMDPMGQLATPGRPGSRRGDPSQQSGCNGVFIKFI